LLVNSEYRLPDVSVEHINAAIKATLLAAFDEKAYSYTMATPEDYEEYSRQLEGILDPKYIDCLKGGLPTQDEKEPCIQTTRIDHDTDKVLGRSPLTYDKIFRNLPRVAECVKETAKRIGFFFTLTHSERFLIHDKPSVQVTLPVHNALGYFEGTQTVALNELDVTHFLDQVNPKTRPCSVLPGDKLEQMVHLIRFNQKKVLDPIEMEFDAPYHLTPVRFSLNKFSNQPGILAELAKDDILLQRLELRTHNPEQRVAVCAESMSSDDTVQLHEGSAFYEGDDLEILKLEMQHHAGEFTLNVCSKTPLDSNFLSLFGLTATFTLKLEKRAPYTQCQNAIQFFSKSTAKIDKNVHDIM